MRSRLVNLKRATEAAPDRKFTGHLVGRIVSVDDHGSAWVDFPDNPGPAPVRARSTLDASAPIGADPQRLIEAQVLLVFEEGDPARPIIVGLVRETLRPPARPPEVQITGKGIRDVLIDGRRLVLEAEQEMVIRCGKSRLTLTKDGRVLIKGEHVVSRATGTNKIKGGSISLN